MFGQLLCHLWGDYILQSDWMARGKRIAWRPAWVHASFYSFCFLPLAWHRGAALLVIFGTHLLIDRFGLARYLVWAKNWIGVSVPWYLEPGSLLMQPRWTRKDNGIVRRSCKQPVAPWEACSATGNQPDCPDWLAGWLTIIADNTLHLTINYLALRFL